jgi:hypothetical protein
MTVRLSAMFDELMRKIINRWKSAIRVKDNKKKCKSKKGSPTKAQLTNGAGKKSNEK